MKEVVKFADISLREWYAGLAMQAIVSQMDVTVILSKREMITRTAFQVADTMTEKGEGS